MIINNKLKNNKIIKNSLLLIIYKIYIQIKNEFTIIIIFLLY
jgi:hypothetical protein